MLRQTVLCSLVIFALPMMAADDEAKDEAINKDRERIKGKWVVTELIVNGNKSQPEDAKKITVVNRDDGTWSIRLEGKEIAKGTSAIDPTMKPKTIDFTPTEGGAKGDQFHGIYELGDQKRKLCFAQAGQERPEKFSSTPGNQHVLVTFERVKPEESSVQP